MLMTQSVSPTAVGLHSVLRECACAEIMDFHWPRRQHSASCSARAATAEPSVIPSASSCKASSDESLTTRAYARLTSLEGRGAGEADVARGRSDADLELTLDRLPVPARGVPYPNPLY